MKLAVLFPGIGYHCDKPLLYYSGKLAAAQGFAIRPVPYGGFEPGIKGKADKMREAFQSALQQSRELLQDVEFSQYETVLFLSKSVGTAVAAAYAQEKGLRTVNVFYTPVEQSFEVMRDPGIVFHGTADPWLDNETFLRECKKAGYAYHLVEGGNHSLETGDALRDIDNLRDIMGRTAAYICRLSGEE